VLLLLLLLLFRLIELAGSGDALSSAGSLEL
jgi:hypothetical protein